MFANFTEFHYTNLPWNPNDRGVENEDIFSETVLNLNNIIQIKEFKIEQRAVDILNNCLNNKKEFNKDDFCVVTMSNGLKKVLLMSKTTMCDFLKSQNIYIHNYPYNPKQKKVLLG